MQPCQMYDLFYLHFIIIQYQNWNSFTTINFNLQINMFLKNIPAEGLSAIDKKNLLLH